MATKLLVLLLVIGLTICAAQVQSQLLTGTPIGSSSPSKHRTPTKTEPDLPVKTAAAEPSAAKAPATSPKPRRTRKKAAAQASPSPTPTPVPSPTPRKFKLRFPRLFKPKSSTSAGPAGVNPAHEPKPDCEVSCFFQAASVKRIEV